MLPEEIPKQVSTEMPSMETPSTEIPSTETPSTKAPSAKTLSTEMPPTVTLSLETPAAQIPEGTAVNTSRPVVVTYPNGKQVNEPFSQATAPFLI